MGTILKKMVALVHYSLIPYSLSTHYSPISTGFWDTVVKMPGLPSEAHRTEWAGVSPFIESRLCIRHRPEQFTWIKSVRYFK